MGCGRRGTEASEQPDGARAAGKKACKHDEPPALSSAESLKLEPVRLIVYKQRGDCRSVRCVFAQICRAVLPKSVAEKPRPCRGGDVLGYSAAALAALPCESVSMRPQDGKRWNSAHGEQDAEGRPR